jgi:glycosyltransferase involved in cell wall biosynthesis
MIAAVIPALNEAATVREVAEGACVHVDRVVVVDDGSDDDTAGRLTGLPVTVLRHAENRGKAASLWDGMQFALEQGATAVVTLDADGQHRPVDIPRLRAAAAAHPERLIIAARLNRREAVPKLRRFANTIADFWISWAAGCRIRDTQSGFRLYPARVIRDVRIAYHRGRGFVFESEILIEAARLGIRPLEIAIDAEYAPGRRPSYYRPWRDTARIVRMVAGKLLARGMDPAGLLRSLRDRN